MLPDGDQIVLHDDIADHWNPSDRCALLVHGLCGCHASRYMVRIARKLASKGVRTFRLDLRGCGAGEDLARLPYHAGCSDDVAEAVNTILRLCPGSPLGVAGFSLGGNIVLKWAGEVSDSPPAGVTAVMAVNPPIDLTLSSQRIEHAARGLYDRHFTQLLMHTVRNGRQWNDDSPLARIARPPNSLCEFDDLFTAPLSGFSGVSDYYEQCSSQRFVASIAIPTLILSSRDDPLIPIEPFEKLDCPVSVQVHLTQRGGHLGYLAQSRGPDPDRHWMDWRVVDWLTGGASSA